MNSIELYIALVVTTVLSLTSLIYLVRHRRDYAEKVVLQSRNKILEHRLHTLLELKPIQTEEMIKIESLAAEKEILLEVARKEIAEVRAKLFESEFRLQAANEKIAALEKLQISLNHAYSQLNQLNNELIAFRSAATTMALMMQKAVKYDRVIYKGFMIEDMNLFTEVRDHILPKMCDANEKSDQAA